MSLTFADDKERDVVIFVNDVFPQYGPALTKLSQKIGRPIKGIIFIDKERRASGNYRSPKEGEQHYDEIIIDFTDDAALRKAVKPFESQLLLISCLSEKSQLYFKRIIPHVPYVNTPTESSLDFCTDKGKMRELLASYESSISPKALTALDASPKTIKKICFELTFPLIVKPSNLAGSLLVNRVDTEDDLEKVLKSSFDALEEVYVQHRGLGSKKIVVEEFVEGDLFSVDVYVDATGKVYQLPFIHFQNGAMAGMDGYQIYQSETFNNLSTDEQRRGALVAEKAVHALALRSSVAHIELFHTAHGWKVIELGARSGGWRQEMYSVSYGVDHAYNELLIKIGLEPEMPARPLLVHSTVFRIHAPVAGILDSIDGIEEARKNSSLYAIRTNLNPGEKALPSTQGGEEVVDGLIVNSDHDQLERELTAIRNSIKLNIKTS